MVVQMFSARRWAGRLAGVLAMLLLGLLPGRPARAQAAASPNGAAETGAAETGAVLNGIFVSATGTSYRDRLRLDRFAAELRAVPFDEVIVQVVAEGEALYDSAILPRALGVEPAFDPLAALLRQLRAPARTGVPGRPKKVIAWVDPYALPVLKSPAAANPAGLLLQHADWLAVRADGAKADENGRQYLEPLLPDVQMHLERVLTELVKRYPLDGLVIDNVADPAGDGSWGYHPAVLEQFARAQGGAARPEPLNPAWVQFRAEGLTQAAEGFLNAARRARPNLPVALTGEAAGPAPATLTDFAATSAYRLRRQNWPAWLARGLGDRFYLKNFRSEQAAADDFDQWLKLALAEAAPRKLPVLATVLGAANESVDALAQLRRATTLGAAGVALADFTTPVKDAGARELFMSAVERAVLAPEPARLRPLAPTLTAADRSTAALAAATPAASVATSSAPLVQTLRPVLRTGAPADDLPPPPPLSEVMADAPAPSAGQPPLSEVLEEGSGNLIPAEDGAARKPPPTPARAGGDPTLRDLNRLPGLDLSGRAAEPTPPPAPPSEYVTRRQMLDEILESPGHSEQRAVFAPDPQAIEELRKKFGNIF